MHFRRFWDPYIQISPPEKTMVCPRSFSLNKFATYGTVFIVSRREQTLEIINLSF